MRVTFLTVMPSPYMQDLFEQLAGQPRIDLRVLYLEQAAPDTHWGIQAMPHYAEVLSGRWFHFLGGRVHWNPAALRKLKSREDDLVVVAGYAGLTNQVVMRSLARRERPWIYWGEIPGLNRRGVVGRWIRSFAQRPLRDATAVVGIGTRATAAYQDLLAASSKTQLFRSIPYYSDTIGFTDWAARRSESTAVRFLYCGQLIARKGVDLLCQAFTTLIERGLDATLTLVGEGELKGSLTDSLPPPVRERVRFLGFQPIPKLPELFAQGDVFMLPSRHDGWGVVVNQAVAAGMPVIATDEVGAAVDLVEHGVNGLRVRTESVDDLVEAMTYFAVDRERIVESGRRSLTMAESITLAKAGETWQSLFEDVLAASRGCSSTAAGPAPYSPAQNTTPRLPH